MSLDNIRNFCIIAHIDAGKSTLADRFLEITNTIEARDMKAQFLDSLDLERERGITIKMAPVRMKYKSRSNLEYILNLIDTPGHPDFGYEVSRAFKAVEGAILLVDATQGIQAQTLANFEMAKKAGLKIIGAVNKIDLNPEQLESFIKETAELIGCREDEIFRISGKTGEGVSELLEAIISNISSPKNKITNCSAKGGSASDGQLSIANAKSALVFDSIYDDHKGVIAYVRVFSGGFKAQEETKLVAANEKIKIKEVGYFLPQMKASVKIEEGEIAYIATGIKDPGKLKIGDTIGNELVAGYEEIQPRVFVSFFPDEGDKYEELKKSLGKLRLNDAALKIEPDSSEVLGRGFKVGFLGKLHFEITSQRLEKEFGVKTVNSFPSVSYKIRKKNGEYSIIENPNDLPEDALEIWEPMIEIELLAPAQYLGSIMKLKDSFRMGDFLAQNIGNRILIKTNMPLVELISDFDDRLKSATNGFASFSYYLIDYKKANLSRIDILVAGDKVPGLSRIVPKENIEYESRQMAQKLRELLPQQQFSQAIQASVGSRIIARETIPAMRKDVTGYLYGGDRTRKMKLWKKQQKGKKKLLSRAKVEISADVFKELLKK